MYKVDNAIILAAGMSKRCFPLSNRLPKGLFVINGQVLLERQIQQIIGAGIPQIILVVGYMAEKFDYLRDKYSVEIVYNPEYAVANNISSLWYAREYLKNSYICGSDNWFNENVFCRYVEESYYSSLYSDSYVDEYCITLKGDDICQIKKGGSRTWYTLGEIFMSLPLSTQLKRDLEREYDTTDIRHLIIDDYCSRHLEQYRFKAVRRKQGSILEFDTLKEIMEFDPFFKERYKLKNI